MNKKDAVIIERTANGWMVRPNLPPTCAINMDEIHVFQHFAYDHAGVQSSDACLVGWLMKHFEV